MLVVYSQRCRRGLEKSEAGEISKLSREQMDRKLFEAQTSCVILLGPHP